VIGLIGGVTMVVATVLTLWSLGDYLSRHGDVFGRPRVR